MGATCAQPARDDRHTEVSMGGVIDSAYSPPAEAAEETLLRLKRTFTGWEDEALEDVLLATDGDHDKAVEMIHAWSCEEHPQGTFLCHSANAGEGTQPAWALRSPTLVLDNATKDVLPRISYDATMSKRLSRKSSPFKITEKGVCRDLFNWTSEMAHKHVITRRLTRKCNSQVALPRIEMPDNDQSGEDFLPEKNPSTEDTILHGDQLLKQRLQQLSLAVQEMEDDGNCQFRAMSTELYGTQDRHQEVRNIAVAHMKKRPDEFSVFFEAEEFDQYLRGMAEPRTWGDELTLRAITDALCVKIHVITTTEENWYLHYDPDDGREPVRQLFLTYLSPIHYNTLRPTK